MRDPLLDQLRHCQCPICRANLREQARYFVFEANADLPHVIIAWCNSCQTNHKFRLNPVGHYYECLPILETADQEFAERG